jgi:alpha-amylase
MKRLIVSTMLMVGLVVTPAIAQSDVAPEHADNWWNDRVFYEIFVRSFYDSDGDGIGDIRGIIEKLDYLNDGDPTTTDDLGITGIWLMPINPSPSYHGYDVTDYYGINPDYGTIDDFRELLQEAHARGIVVIMDLVMNHTSDQIDWFIESQDPTSEYADWYVWSDDYPGFRGPDGQVVWHTEAGRYYYGIFVDFMPDLNYLNPEVTEAMYAINQYWLEDVGVDGFRLDAIKFLIAIDDNQESTPETLTWLENYHDYIHSIEPDALIVGEVWSDTTEVARYVNEQVDLAFEFRLAEDMVRSAAFRTSSGVLNQLETVLESYPSGQYATFLTNHDQDRVMSQVRGEVGNAKVAATMLLTLPGVPFIYYGEEIGMTGVKPDEDIRRPMQWNAEEDAGFTEGDPWRAPDANYHTVNVAAETDNPDSLLSTYRDLIHARSSSPAMLRGDFTLVESSERKVVAFLRQHETETVLVLLNLDDVPVSEYALTLDASSIDQTAIPELLLGTGDVTPPELNDTGGSTDYVPLPELPPESATIIRLTE